jgi:putative spermidine/putrescine transport system substrate-binding protein
MDMRARFSPKVAALAATVLLAPLPGHAADLVVGAFGGVWEQSLRKCIVEPWTKATGKTVDIVLGTPTQWLNQIAASRGKPPLVLIYNPTETAYEAISRGLVDRFTPETVPNMQNLVPQLAAFGDGYGTVHNYGAMGIMYNAQTVKETPKTWKDFVEGTIAGKWKASMPNINYPSAGFTVSVWWLAKQFGGDVNNIEPGLAQVNKMLDSGNLVFWTDPNAVLNGMKSGDIDMALYWDGRAYSFIDDGNKEFKYYSPEPGVIVAMTWIQKIKGSSDLGYSFANFTLSKDAQSCFGSAIRYGIANKDATFDPKIAHEITPAERLVFPPFKEVATLQGKWLETWNKEIGR